MIKIQFDQDAYSRLIEALKSKGAFPELLKLLKERQAARRKDFYSSPLGSALAGEMNLDLEAKPVFEGRPVALDEAGTQPVLSPVIGGLYWISVVVVRHDWLGLGNRVVPITGPLHEDREIIKFPADHWHVDWRFVNDALLWDAAERRRQHPSVIVVPFSSVVKHLGVIRVRKRCLRPMPRFPVANVQWARPLEEKYAKAKMKCLTCPHRGMALDPATADEKGVIRCPAHGLQWDVGTGNMVPAISPTSGWEWSLDINHKPRWTEAAP